MTRFEVDVPDTWQLHEDQVHAALCEHFAADDANAEAIDVVEMPGPDDESGERS